MTKRVIQNGIALSTELFAATAFSSSDTCKQRL